MGKGLDVHGYKVYVDGLHYLSYTSQEEAIHAAEQYAKTRAREVKVVAVMEVEVWNERSRR